MKVQATLLLSALLLGSALVGISASPVPISLLSRLRRSAGTTADVPTGSTAGATLETRVYTTEESLSTMPPSSTSRSRLSRQTLDGLTLSDDLSVHYSFLHVQAIEVSREHRRLFANYKTERFANDSDPVIRDMALSYLPNEHNLPDDSIRPNYPDSELVTLHYTNLILFRDTLSRVKASETADVSRRVDVVIQELLLVIDRLEITMFLQGQEAHIIRAENAIPPFHTDVTTLERNMRTLYVLQEFHAYLPHVRHDYRILANRHS